MIIPVSKVSIGIATGGVDHVAKANADKQDFYGGNGAGLSVSPVAFIVISSNGDAKILNMNAASAAAVRLC